MNLALVYSGIFYIGVGVSIAVLWHFSPRWSANLLLRAWSAKRYEGNDPALAPLEHSMAQIAHAARLPAPELWVVPSFSPNIAALPFGGGRGAIVVTNGLLHELNGAEVATLFRLCLENFRTKDLTLMLRVAILLWPLRAILQSFPRFFSALLEPVWILPLRLVLRNGRIYALDQRVVANKAQREVYIGALRKSAVSAIRLSLEQQNVLTAPFWFFQNRAAARELWRFFYQPPTVDERIARIRNTRLTT